MSRRAGAAQRHTSAGRRTQRFHDRRRRRLRWWLWSGGAAAVMLGGIAIALVTGHTSGSTTSTGGPQVSLTGGSGSAVGQRAPTFTAATIDGASFRVPAGKPAVIYFMAGWCSSCMPESQALGRIATAYDKRVAILAVDADPTDPLSSLEHFRSLVGNPAYPFAQDQDGKLVQGFAASALDTTVVLNAAGTVVYRNSVPIDDAALRAALSQAGAA